MTTPDDLTTAIQQITKLYMLSGDIETRAWKNIEVIISAAKETQALRERLERDSE